MEEKEDSVNMTCTSQTSKEGECAVCVGGGGRSLLGGRGLCPKVRQTLAAHRGCCQFRWRFWRPVWKPNKPPIPRPPPPPPPLRVFDNIPPVGVEVVVFPRERRRSGEDALWKVRSIRPTDELDNSFIMPANWLTDS